MPLVKQYNDGSVQALCLARTPTLPSNMPLVKQYNDDSVDAMCLARTPTPPSNMSLVKQYNDFSSGDVSSKDSNTAW